MKVSLQNFHDQGFCLLHDFLAQSDIAKVKQDIPFQIEKSTAASIRNIEKKSQVVDELIHAENIISIASECLGAKVQFVRAILFNKTPEKNWSVTWHQDRTVAVSRKFDAHGWHAWSLKEGVHHVHPPEAVLNNMVACRINLDKSDRDLGCLQVIPNSHESGVLSHAEIQSFVAKSQPKNCEGEAGSMLVMRPHILHASRKMKLQEQRRVLHIEYTSATLPKGINWA